MLLFKGEILLAVYDTKYILANALLEICREKRFKKVSVSMITTHCALNRQTFYYHFTDKYELLAFTYATHALAELDDSTTLENWEQHTASMLAMMKKERAFYRNTTCDEMAVLGETFSTITTRLLMEMFERLDTNKQIAPDNRAFYARFFSYGCSGVLIEWIYSDFQASPLVIAESLHRLAKDVELIAYHRYVSLDN